MIKYFKFIKTGAIILIIISCNSGQEKEKRNEFIVIKESHENLLLKVINDDKLEIKTREAAIQYYINKGVSLYFDEKMNLTSFDCSRPAGLKNDDMKYIVFFPETGAVHLSGKDITDSVFYYLQDLKMLTALSLYDTSVNGEGFKYIIDNRELIVFDFGGSPITDSGLKYISQIEFKKHIIILNLKESKITDEGMKSISKMKLGQVRINIQSTQITDKGIEYLFNFKNAIEIDLRNCKISDTGVSRLKKAIPGASIIWGILPPVDQTVY